MGDVELHEAKLIITPLTIELPGTLETPYPS